MAWYRDGGGLSRAPCYESRDHRPKAGAEEAVGAWRYCACFSRPKGSVLVAPHYAPSKALGAAIPKARHDEDSGVALCVRVAGGGCGQSRESVTRAWLGRLGLASPAHLLTATSGRPIKVCGVHIDRQGRVTIGTFVNRPSAAGVCVCVCGSSWPPDSLESPRCTCVTCFSHSLHVLHVERVW